MGLDIVASRNIRKVECSDSDCEHAHLHVDPAFRAQADGITDGCYEYDAGKDGTMRFRAGSYSGYYEWRASLSKAFLGTEPDFVWKHADKFVGKPFVELVNFSDCDGFIGPVTSAKLARDFLAFEEAARVKLDEYSFGKYLEWKRAFEIASDSGAVRFV